MLHDLLLQRLYCREKLTFVPALFFFHSMSRRVSYSGCKKVKELDRNLVTIVCWDCRRIGVYPLERFKQLVGEETLVPDAIRLIAEQTCPKAAQRHGLLSDRCRASFYQPGLEDRD